MRHGVRLLEQAIYTVDERDQQYGSVAAFAAELAQRWSITLGIAVTPQQVILCLLDLKLVRLRQNPRHADSIKDVAGYAACLAEINQTEAAYDRS